MSMHAEEKRLMPLSDVGIDAGLQSLRIHEDCHHSLHAKRPTLKNIQLILDFASIDLIEQLQENKSIKDN